MLTAVLEEVVRGPAADDRFGKHLLIEPTIETSRAGRYATQAVVVTAAARRIIELSKGGEKLQNIVVAGDKDPTLNPDFREISENLRELCNKWFARAKMCVISPTPRVEDPDVRQGLVCYDRALVRLEAGTQKTYAALSGDAAKNFKPLVEGLANLDLSNIVVQACFVRGAVDNSTDNEVRAWLRYLAGIKPAAVEIWTLAKPDADRKTKGITKTRMGEIVEMISEKLGVTPLVLDPQ